MRGVLPRTPLIRSFNACADIYRGTAKAWAGDAKSLAICLQAIESELDKSTSSLSLLSPRASFAVRSELTSVHLERA
jgi:hypothetical protein